MGYLRDFRTRFAAQLSSMTPDQIEAVLNTACNAVLESYRNGLKSAPAARPAAGGRAPRPNGKGARPKPPRHP